MRAEYSYCRDYLIKNGKPWFPVMGEMHYSRYRKEWWEESLRKIKAGGVSVVSAYVIWIHHEEEENVFDFEGCRDIGTFVRLCRKVGLSVFLRIGPFVHGEVRNGRCTRRPVGAEPASAICFRSWAATVKHHGIRERARLSRTQTLCSATQGTMH